MNLLETKKQSQKKKSKLLNLSSSPSIIKRCRSNRLNKLFEIDATVPVSIRFPDHPRQLLRRQRVPQLRHRVRQLRRRYVPVPVAVEHLEDGFELVLRVGALDETWLDKGDELGELDDSVVVPIRFVDQSVELVLARLQTEGSEKRG